jgi:cyanophycin synthetase
VLNADNCWTVEMARVAQGEIIFFSMDRTNPIIEDHLREEGRAVVLRSTPHGDMLTLVDHRRETSILLAQDIPATADGRIRVNIANALAATAAAIASDVDLSSIRDGLRSFTSSFAQTPGRFNVLSIEGRQVVIDYGHNVHGLEAIADFVKRTAAHQSIGVIAIAGDRRDEDIRAFGELAARTFDRLIIREHDDPRGRERGEVAAILRDAVRAAGLPEDCVEVILDEIDAVHAAIDLANPGDLVFLLVYRISRVWDSLARRAAGQRSAQRASVIVR